MQPDVGFRVYSAGGVQSDGAVGNCYLHTAARMDQNPDATERCRV